MLSSPFQDNSYPLGWILPNMDAIVVLNGGRLVTHGSYDEVEMECANLLKQPEHDVEFSAQSAGPQNGPKQVSQRETFNTSNENGATPFDVLSLQRSNGSWAVYSYYARAAGTLSLLLLAFFTLISSIATNYMSKLFSAVFHNGLR